MSAVSVPLQLLAEHLLRRLPPYHLGLMLIHGSTKLAPDPVDRR